jgi:hypothetical protein
MLFPTSSLLVSLTLTAGINAPAPPLLPHHDIQAYVTGYNTIPGQTDSTPCIAASGADICGRRDAVACPRHIGLGTVVQIRGDAYVCEDRLAKKFDDRFDISCDKDTACPPQVTGWTTIRVFDIRREVASSVTAAPPITKVAAIAPAPSRTVHAKTAKHEAPRRAEPRRAMAQVAAQKPASPIAVRLASALKSVSVLRGHG